MQSSMVLVSKGYQLAQAQGDPVKGVAQGPNHRVLARNGVTCLLCVLLQEWNSWVQLLSLAR
jgi:hypothetical protein